MRIKTVTNKDAKKEAHRVRMDERKAKRKHLADLFQDSNLYIEANLSMNHPDSGMSMEDHKKAKLERAKK